MISSRRFLSVLIVASVLNAILFTTAFRKGDALMDGAFLNAEYWILPPIGLFVWVGLFSFAFTFLGLTFLLVISRLAIPYDVSGFLAKSAFVLGGAALGYVVFGLLIFETAVPTVFGAVAALTFTVMCPRWFDPWDEAALAEP